ncbi:MAG: hypothetical protein WAP51_01940 [Candidatus Sungiibacteriota bacterium]
MKDLDRKLKKFSLEERSAIEHLVKKILKREIAGLDFKKLKGLKNFFRVRKGNIRIIFELKSGEEPIIITIERRKENTYKL